MLSFNGRTKIFAATSPVDLRKSYDSLYAYCKDVIKKEPTTGHVFLFINRSRTRLKALFWDGTGLVLVCKRLEDGKFTRLNTLEGPSITMTAAEFALLLEGSDMARRFIESPKKYRQFSDK